MASAEEINKESTGILRIIAIVTSVAGAVGSLGFMFHMGRNQASIILIMLFTGWVLSPFAALLMESRMAKRWTFIHPGILSMLMLIIPVGSVIGYSGMLSPPGAKPAAVFLIIPLISWVLIVTAVVVFTRKNKIEP